MSRLTRLIVGLVVIELLLLGLWFWLMTLPGQTPEAPRVIGEVMGGAMGVVAGLGLVMIFVTIRRERRS